MREGFLEVFFPYYEKEHDCLGSQWEDSNKKNISYVKYKVYATRNGIQNFLSIHTACTPTDM
jgi:hypothetical protein